jgi:squalene-associated FAD-dependent desaturase
MSRVHVVGGGIAGLSAALALADAGRPITLYEAGPAAGGRCRSYYDRELGCRIDNGNHLWLSGNAGITAFLRRVGSEGTLAGPPDALFPFMDLRTGARWVVHPNAGRLPWWVLSRKRGVPGAKLSEYAGLAALLRAGPGATVAQVLKPGPLYDRLLEPLVIAALNTAPATGSARLMAAVVRETLARGGAACVPAFPRDGLSASFIDPAIAALQAAGAEIRLGSRVAGLQTDAGRATGLATADGTIAVAPGESVVLAVPAPVAQGLLPGLTAPDAFEAIVNLHYRIDADPGPAGFIGLLGGLAEWVFVKSNYVSVTVSAASLLVERAASDLAATVWPEVSASLRLSQAMPPWRVVKEKRATFAATPDQDRKRPASATALGNLVLAGDWTATGLPATIEGAIRSGRTAAQRLLAPA